jgi:ribonuclease T1
MTRRLARSLSVFIVLTLIIGCVRGSDVQASDPTAVRTKLYDGCQAHTNALNPTSTPEAYVTADRQKRGPPQKAKDLLRVIQDHEGEPPPGYVGGRTFHNRERRLPQGLYREYDVNPKRLDRPRDAERIVIEQKTGKAYYSVDHYRTFTPLN